MPGILYSKDIKESILQMDKMLSVSRDQWNNRLPSCVLDLIYIVNAFKFSRKYTTDRKNNDSVPQYILYL